MQITYSAADNYSSRMVHRIPRKYEVLDESIAGLMEIMVLKLLS